MQKIKVSSHKRQGKTVRGYEREKRVNRKTMSASSAAQDAAGAAAAADMLSDVNSRPWDGFVDTERQRWEQKGFGPDEAQGWAELGTDENVAAPLRDVGKTPQDYRNSPEESIGNDYTWAKEGQEIWEERDDWQDSGVWNGHKAAAWKKSGYTPDDVTEWRHAGFEVENGPVEAVIWESQGFSAKQAGDWGPKSANRHGREYSPSSAMKLRGQGWTPETATERIGAMSDVSQRAAFEQNPPPAPR